MARIFYPQFECFDNTQFNYINTKMVYKTAGNVIIIKYYNKQSKRKCIILFVNNLYCIENILRYVEN